MYKKSIAFMANIQEEIPSQCKERSVSANAF